MPTTRHNARRRRRTASWVVGAVVLLLALWALLIWALASAGGGNEGAAEGPDNWPVSRGVAADRGPGLVRIQDEVRRRRRALCRVVGI